MVSYVALASVLAPTVLSQAAPATQACTDLQAKLGSDPLSSCYAQVLGPGINQATPEQLKPFCLNCAPALLAWYTEASVTCKGQASFASAEAMFNANQANIGAKCLVAGTSTSVPTATAAPTATSTSTTAVETPTTTKDDSAGSNVGLSIAAGVAALVAGLF